MILLLYIAMLFSLLTAVTKASLLKRWERLTMSALFVIFCMLMVPASIDSSSTVIDSYLSDLQLRQIVAIIATIECVMSFAFAFREHSKETAVNAHTTVFGKLTDKLSHILWIIHKHYVPILIFPTLFYLQTQLLYTLPGVNFYVPAIVVGVGAGLITLLLAMLLQQSFPNKSQRESLLLFVSLILSVSVLLSTNSDEILTSRPSLANTNTYKELLITAIGFLLLFIIGFVLQIYKKRKNY